jgi:hypothetical protein
MQSIKHSFSNRCAILLLILMTAGIARADSDVTLTIDGQPAKPGDLKPTDIHSLVVDNGILKITFGKDATDGFSATSVIKNGQELAHNLH